jgi:tetratricopeptide (TPR) repeat protein
MRSLAEAKAILAQLILNPSKPATEDKVAPINRERTASEPLKSEAGTPAETSPEPPKERPWADLLMGIIHFEEENMDEALTSLLRAERSNPRLPDLHLRIGNVYLRQRRTDDAERAFERALEIDGDSAEAHLGLAMVHLRKRRNEQAAEQALHAVGLQHFLPLGHFYLGVGLARLSHRERAVLAFETSLTMLPGLMAAHRWLAALYRQPGGDPEKAARHSGIYMQMRQERETKAHA